MAGRPWPKQSYRKHRGALSGTQGDAEESGLSPFLLCLTCMLPSEAHAHRLLCNRGRYAARSHAARPLLIIE